MQRRTRRRASEWQSSVPYRNPQLRHRIRRQQPRRFSTHISPRRRRRLRRPSFDTRLPRSTRALTALSTTRPRSPQSESAKDIHRRLGLTLSPLRPLLPPHHPLARRSSLRRDSGPTGSQLQPSACAQVNVPDLLDRPRCHHRRRDRLLHLRIQQIFVQRLVGQRPLPRFCSVKSRSQRPRPQGDDTEPVHLAPPCPLTGAIPQSGARGWKDPRGARQASSLEHEQTDLVRPQTGEAPREPAATAGSSMQPATAPPVSAPAMMRLLKTYLYSEEVKAKAARIWQTTSGAVHAVDHSPTISVQQDIFNTFAARKSKQRTVVTMHRFMIWPIASRICAVNQSRNLEATPLP